MNASGDPDVLVIGAGVAGLFCAYFLRLGGARVTVVERGQVGGPQSCSYGNTGFVGTQGTTPLAEPGVMAQGLRWLLDSESPFYIKPRMDSDLLAWLWSFRGYCTPEAALAGSRVLLDLKRHSLRILRELCDRDSAFAGCLLRGGMVVAYKTAAAFARARESVPGARLAGVPLRVLSAADLAGLEPGTRFAVAGALLNEEGAYLRVPEFVSKLGELLARMSVPVHEHTEVTGFDEAGGQVLRVRTTRGDFSPREVVVAAGAWSAQCVRGLGVRLKLQPAKGYTVTVRTPAGAPRLPVLLSEGKVAVAPFGETIRFGGTLELSGLSAAGLNTGISRRRVAGIERTVRSYLPQLGPAETVATWSGLRSCSPDGLPLTGRVPRYRNLSVCCGHSHVGLGLAPCTGLLMAQLISGAKPGIDPAPLRVDRFGGGRR
jgi:D-amino-acid dehydrogenase